MSVRREASHRRAWAGAWGVIYTSRAPGVLYIRRGGGEAVHGAVTSLARGAVACVLLPSCCTSVSGQRGRGAAAAPAVGHDRRVALCRSFVRARAERRYKPLHHLKHYSRTPSMCLRSAFAVSVCARARV